MNDPNEAPAGMAADAPPSWKHPVRAGVLPTSPASSQRPGCLRAWPTLPSLFSTISAIGWCA